MIRFLVDHCFDHDYLRAMQRYAARQGHLVEVNLARDLGLARAKDPEILTWAAKNGMVVLTHDRNTLPGHAHARTRASLPMAGVVVVDDRASVSAVAEDLVLLAFATSPEDWQGQIHYVPL